MRDEIETYLNYLRSNEYSENTIIAYRKALILFFDFLAERDLSKDVLIELKKALIGKRQMTATINL